MIFVIIDPDFPPDRPVTAPVVDFTDLYMQYSPARPAAKGLLEVQPGIGKRSLADKTAGGHPFCAFGQKFQKMSRQLFIFFP
ncbi:MAG: hypothetical protein Q8932_08875 [Bacteroidota bacterium]|nr:hypothetical protein [Bacteroidota bacterium]